MVAPLDFNNALYECKFVIDARFSGDFIPFSELEKTNSHPVAPLLQHFVQVCV